MGISTIIAGIVAAFVGIFAAFAAGQFRGKTKAASDARIKYGELETARVLDSIKKSTDAQINVSNTASEVRNEVANLNPGDAINELRRDYSRNTNGNESN